MTVTPHEGIRITEVRIANFRSLGNVIVPLSDLTVLIGANNAGKTSFLDAVYAAIGTTRRQTGREDIHLAPGELEVPRDRRAVIDVIIRPTDAAGKLASSFPAGSFWTNLWGEAIGQELLGEIADFVGIRTTLAWHTATGEYRLERKFLKDWLEPEHWLDAEEKDRVSSFHIEPLALHYIDAKRDIDDDLRQKGSFWRRLTDDLGLTDADILEFETTLTLLNQDILARSTVLKHIQDHLAAIQTVVSAESAGIDIASVPRHLRDLSKGVDVSLTTASAQAFPLTRYGMGTRSLASLLVFRAYASWKQEQVTSSGDAVHTVLALEEPEAHLHPQAQRSLFTQIRGIPGQRIVSTHSPYFAGQATLDQLRLFRKAGPSTTVTALDLSALTADEQYKIETTIVQTRGDLLFARAVVLFEGATEELALPILAHAHWSRSVHELGLSFVGVGGKNSYFPFVSLARQLGIPWFIFSDGEADAIVAVNQCLMKLEGKEHAQCPNVIVLPNGADFEQYLFDAGYLPEIEASLNSVYDEVDYLTGYMARLHGQQRSKTEQRDYSGAAGRGKAAVDALTDDKLRLAIPVARAIVSRTAGPKVPVKAAELFTAISSYCAIPAMASP